MTMRVPITLFLLVATVAAAVADDKSARERRVRVALALAGSAPAVGDPAACGVCRTDVKEAKVEALRDHRPVVLFVGGPCGGLAKTAEAAGAIPAKLPSYTSDDRPAEEKRAVVLEPKADGSGFFISATLPAKADAQAMTDAVRKATPKPPAVSPVRLNWNF
jgi:hypothetical protein